MGNKERIPSCKEIKDNVGVADYLESLGILPQEKKGNDYWYLSPLPGRNEKTPSFHLDHKNNQWYDHGTGQGGTIIDFGVLYYGCSINEFRQKFTDKFSFQTLPSLPRTKAAAPPKEGPEKKIKILDARYMIGPRLRDYLHSRGISIEVANLFFKEVDFELYGKRYTALGFPNDLGGFELRNEFFKGSSSPKAITTILKGNSEIAVFEGSFNFLTHMMIKKPANTPPTDYLILNSLAFFDKSLELMMRYQAVNLYLDRGVFGSKKTAEALELGPRFHDQSILYKGYEDLNDFWIGIGKGRPRAPGMHRP